jgi:DNA-binding Xre family transcriptional regulator
MIEKLIGPITGLLDKFIEDKDQKAKLAHEIATMSQKYAQEIAKGQMESIRLKLLTSLCS